MATLHRRHAIDPEERGSVKTARVFSPSPSTPLHFHPYIRSPWDTCFVLPHAWLHGSLHSHLRCAVSMPSTNNPSSARHAISGMPQQLRVHSRTMLSF